ncbi:MAG: GNAT family N-acetyltransferase [Anaerolineae bacterium]|nr:GNAT family N-acetyltransferase [Anaerolineae bacterium]
MSFSSHINFYQAADLPELVTCWNDAFGGAWLSNAQQLRIMIEAEGPCQAREHLIARVNGHIAGFLITQMQYRSDFTPHPSGSITAMGVARWAQRKGIGRDLLGSAVDYFRGIGAKAIRLGGHTPRFFAGIPTNLPGALDFFRTQGWQPGTLHYDFVRSVRDYRISDEIAARIKAEKLSLEAAQSPQEAKLALTFEAREFPAWLAEHSYPVEVGDYHDLLIARDSDGRIVGTLLMYSPDAHPKRGDTLWRTLLGEDAGGINAVGVAKSERGRGIGVALVARASEILRERGAGNVLIGWTTLGDFYGKVGYQVWREYAACVREL